MRTLIVDNQPLFAQALSRLVTETRVGHNSPGQSGSGQSGSGQSGSGQSGSGEAVIAGSIDEALAIPQSANDLAFLNVERPVSNTPKAVGEVIARHPGIRVIALMTELDIRLLREAMRAGAHGAITRTSDPATFRIAIDKVMAGGRYVPDDLPDGPVSGFQDMDGAADSEKGRTLLSESGFSNLTPRQQEVLKLLALGQANQEIAAQLGIALATVKLHVNAILRALNVRNRTEAAAMAIVGGLTEQASTRRPAPHSLTFTTQMTTPAVD